MPRIPGAKDVILQPLWDSVRLASGTLGQVTLFQQPKGQGASVWGTATTAKTLADTNMNLAGQIGSGWQFTCYTIQVSFNAGITAADAIVLADTGVIEFIVGAKTYLEIPVVNCSAGAGVTGFGYTATTATNTTVEKQYVTNGHPGAKDVFGLGELPISVMENENFSVRLSWAAGASTAAETKIRVLLNGQLSRGVQ
jgi:hypothetical protein